MLEVAKVSLRDFSERLEFIVADARDLRLPDACTDVVLAGWVFGHFRAWMPERVTRPGGRAFFGNEFAAMVRRERWRRVSDCTGIGSLTI